MREYIPPKMIHGDCHLHQFFFDRGMVTGVVDMEVASAGDPIADLIKLFLEASSILAGYDWVRDFFKGYGQQPDFETFRLRLLCCELPEFHAAGWKGDYEVILSRLLTATSWKELISLPR